MKRYEGRYVAQVIIDFDIPVTDSMLPFEKVKHNIQKELTGQLRELICNEVRGENGMRVEVIQQYADLVEVDADE